MRVMTGTLAALLLVSCSSDDAPNPSAEEIQGAQQQVLQDGFTLPSGMAEATLTTLEVPGAPHKSWSYTFPADTNVEALETALKEQLPERGYTMAVDNDTGFAAEGPDGAELGLIVIEAEGQRSIQVLFTKPAG